MILDQADTFGLSVLQRSLLAGAAGSVVMVLVQTQLTMPAPAMLYSFGLGVLTFAGASLALPRKKHLAERLLDMDGLGQGDATRLAGFIGECRAYTAQLEQLHAQHDGVIYETVTDIIDWSYKIIQGIIDDPRDLTRSRTFRIYLKAAVEILEKVTDLEQKGADQAAVQDIRERCETVLKQIRSAFEKQYEKNLANDVLSVDVDLDVLTKALKREGL